MEWLHFGLEWLQNTGKWCRIRGSGAENSGKWCRKYGEVVYVYVYVYVYGGRLKGVQVVGRNVFPTTCTLFSRRSAEGGTSGREKCFPYHLYPLQPGKVHFQDPKVHFQDPKVHFQDPKVRRRPAEGGTSGRDKCFPYHLYPLHLKVHFWVGMVAFWVGMVAFWVGMVANMGKW